MILTIGIPTYNRSKYLKKNLEQLCGYIQQLNAVNKVEILISDNCSTDNTHEIIDEVTKEYTNIAINPFYNTKNSGAGPNLLNVVCNAKTPYVMLLGDDDYICKEYLKKVLDILLSGESVCVLPSYYNIDAGGKPNGRGRDVEKKSSKHRLGFGNCMKNAWRAHQLSGIVFRKEQYADEFLEKKIDNLYPQIFIMANNCLHNTAYHITDYPVKVTRPPMKEKTWGYGDDGLLCDIFKNFYYLDELSCFQRTLLEIKILDVMYWRTAMYIKVSLKAFIKCLVSIQSNKYTTVFTKMFLPLIVLITYIKNGVYLLFSGKLLRTLKTNVDI